MDGFDKRIRRSALKLAAAVMALGFLIGLAVGATVAYYTIERTVVVPLSKGIEV